MTEPITRHQDSERRGRIMSPAGAPPADSATGRVRPAAWFAGGRRRPYDPARRTLAPVGHTGLPHVFERVHGDPSPDGHWVSMLPGFPDGSYGWAQVNAQLHGTPSPRLYVEYRGQGDSDKPRNYAYSTIERADLVETLWAAHRVTAALGNELTWDIAGSALDPFEPRQIRAARHRLDPTLVRIHNLPGGHLTTSEHPNLLANLIRALPATAARPAPERVAGTPN